MWRRLVWEKCTNVSDELAASIMINEPAASSAMSEHTTRPPTRHQVQQGTNLQNDRNENVKYYITGMQSHELTTVITNSRRGQKIIPINIHSHNQLTYSWL